MTEPQKIHHEYIDVAGRLDELSGLKEDWLREAVEFGTNYIRECTDNDPSQLPGILGWGKITRGLCERLIPKGFSSANVGGQASIIAADGSFRIVVAGGDERTGLVGPDPSTRSSKGSVTAKAVDDNVLSFADVEPSFTKFEKKTLVAPKQIWMLLYYVDEVNDEVRMELSLPNRMDVDGHVVSFRERIILTPNSLQSGLITIIDEDEDEDDDDGFQVTRRTG